MSFSAKEAALNALAYLQGKAKKAVKTVTKEVKKQDKPTPDDKPAAGVTAPAAGVSEIIEDEDEDEKKGVRRRARRD